MNAVEHGLAGRFLTGLARSADGWAVRTAAEDLTYTQLHHQALAVAGTLNALRPSAIGVLAGRNAAGYRALLAALYTGVTVVPLSPTFPASRLREIVAAAGVDVLVADETSARVVAELRRAGVDLSTIASDGGDHRSPLEAPIPVHGSDVAYVLFTSGSTGRPKGVPVTHDNTAHYFGVLDARYPFGPTDVFSQTFDLNFDCAFFDMFTAWGAGATLAVPGPLDFRSLPTFVAGYGVTVWFSTPSAISLVRRTGSLTENAMPSLRWSLFAGEALGTRDALDWYRAAPNSVVENLYGPTELTITIAAHRLDVATDDRAGSVPIGTVHPGHDVLLLPLDDGASDELCIAGPQLTAGYLDPADDEGRFVVRDGVRFYRTGDRVRQDETGALIYLGRLDSQVQVHGVRVELAEVESAVRACPGVEDAVCVAVPVDGSTELAVFHTGSPLPAARLARDLHAVLPAPAIPRRFTHLDEYPLNANRKIDRRTLAAMAAESATPRSIS